LDKINIAHKFGLFSDLWSPKLVAEMNGQYVKLARGSGELMWHTHDDEDEFFLVMSGHLEIHLRDRTVSLDPGEFFVVPRGVEHKPVASEGTQILLIEPKSTLHTGSVETDRTVAVADQNWI